MKNNRIHPTVVIEPGAQIADDVRIGPFSYIGADVKLHSGVQIKSHVVIKGITEIGENCYIPICSHWRNSARFEV